MTKFLSVRKPQSALMVMLIVLSTILAACGDSPTTAPATTAATSATTAAAGATTAAGGTATTAAAGAATTAAAAAGPAVKITVFSPQFPDQDLANNAFTKFIAN